MKNKKNNSQQKYYPLCYLFARKNKINKSIDNINRRKFYNHDIKGLDFTNKFNMLVQ